MKQHPILFSTEMVQAILAGRKTKTRRTKGLESAGKHSAPKLIPRAIGNESDWDKWYFETDEGESILISCPYGKPGDVLWVRETWFSTRFDCKELLQLGDTSHIRYKANNNYDPKSDCVGRSWKPSIHMPKEACRIWLRITDIQVERLQEISEEDAKAEGVIIHERGIKWLNYMDKKHDTTQFIFNCNTAKESFKTLWISINGLRDEPSAWFRNPWVWVVKFERIDNLETNP